MELASERDPATENDLMRGRRAEKALFDHWNIIDTKGHKLFWLNLERDSKQIFDFLAYNEKKDFALPIEIEGKDRFLFDKALKGYESNGKIGFESLHFANKKFYNLKTEKIRNSFINIIGRPLTDKELDMAVAIMIPLDAHKKLDFGFKINIKKSVYDFYDFNNFITLKNGNTMPYNPRRKQKEIVREYSTEQKLDYYIDIPFKEVKMNDYRF